MLPIHLKKTCWEGFNVENIGESNTHDDTDKKVGDSTLSEGQSCIFHPHSFSEDTFWGWCVQLGL